MITVAIGGLRFGEKVTQLTEAIGPNLTTLTAGISGSFLAFCRRVVDSTQIISRVDHQGKIQSRFKANDNFCVHFCEQYLEKHLDKGTTLLKIATVVETALDLGLDIQVILLDAEAQAKLGTWPKHWPWLKGVEHFDKLIRSLH